MTSSRPEFETLWDTHQLGARTMTMQATQTLVPSESLLAGDQSTIPDLPRILSASGSGSQLKVVGEIGRGGMGVIRLGRQIALRREVAIKQVREDRRSEHAATSLTTEGLLVGALEHPNIVPVYLLGEDDDGYPTLVMKRIDGVSWTEVLRGEDVAVGPGPDEDPLEWHLDVLMQVSNAVHFAHSRGIIHRDLKPDNVMVGGFGEVYLLDWGIAVSTSDDRNSPFPKAANISDVSGTPAYMAPEMVAGNGAAIGPRTDVYLLGAMLHEVITGTPRHSGDSMFAIMHSAYESAPVAYEGVAPELGRICNRAMARDPEDRFQDADEFRRAISTFLRHRESLKFGARASTLADTMSALIGDGADPEEIYATFQKALFTYDAALEAWEANDDARQGRAALLEAMFLHEVEAEDARGAKRVLSMMSAPTEQQQEVVTKLVEASQEKDRAAEALTRLRYDRDLSVMTKWRAFIHFDIGIFWAVAIVIYYFWGELASHWWMVGSAFVSAASGALVLWWKREIFLPNQVARQLVSAYGVSILVVTLVHLVIHLTGAPVYLAFIFDMVGFAAVSGAVALTVDRSMLAASAGFALFVILASVFKDYAFYIVAGGVTVVQTVIAAADFWLNGRSSPSQP